MRRVEGGDVCSVTAAIEISYVAVDSHLGVAGGVVAEACLSGADGDIIGLAAAYDTYGSAGFGCLEVELYRCSVFDSKGDIAARVWRAAYVGTGSSGYVGIVLIVLHLPVFGGGVLFVGGEDGSVIRRRRVVYRQYISISLACPIGQGTVDMVESRGREAIAVAI